MNSLPRRSARLSQLHQQQTSNSSITSSSSHSSSLSSSSYPSPNDNFAQQQEQARLQLRAQLLSLPPQFNAPLPSPSATEFNSFFGYLQTQQDLSTMPQQSQQITQQSHQQHNRTSSDTNHHQQQQQQQHAAGHHNSFSSQNLPNMQSGGNAGQLPPDFLAEAAKRAQIACLMRDMGDVTL